MKRQPWAGKQNYKEDESVKYGLVYGHSTPFLGLQWYN